MSGPIGGFCWLAAMNQDRCGCGSSEVDSAQQLGVDATTIVETAHEQRGLQAATDTSERGQGAATELATTSHRHRHPTSGTLATVRSDGVRPTSLPN